MKEEEEEDEEEEEGGAFPERLVIVVIRWFLGDVNLSPESKENQRVYFRKEKCKFILSNCSGSNPGMIQSAMIQSCLP